MEAATTHLLTALYALAHGLALTGEDGAEVERHRAGLRPELWRETKRLLREADRGPDGTTLDLGFLPLVLRWLGVASEDAFAAEFGVGAAEAIARDRGRLAEIAVAIEDPGASCSDVLRFHLTLAWYRRAAMLLPARPETGRAAVEALEHTLAHCPSSDVHRRQLSELLLAASEACGDLERAQNARRSIAALDAEALSRTDRVLDRDAATVVLTILLCICHDDFLLDGERGLDPEIEAAPETWDQVCSAIAAGRIEEVPIPVRTYAAWCLYGGVDERLLRSCLEETRGQLAELARAVELLWGGAAGEWLAPSPAACQVLWAAQHRRACLHRAWRPLPGERPDIWHELNQGARRPETVERLDLICRVQLLFLRCTVVDPMPVALLHLDRAAECESLGEYAQERLALEQAAQVTRDAEDDPAQRDYGEACLAAALWRAGEPAAARRRLQGLEGPEPSEFLGRIEAAKPERKALRIAEGVARRQGDVASQCAVALAHVRAGHSARGEALANDLCLAHPQDPLAWATLARALHDNGRYRDAVGPARTALEKGYGAPGSALLARILSHVGPDGRAESTQIAVAAIEAHPVHGALTCADLADLARIAHDAGAPLAVCRLADDYVWRKPDGERPREWLGAAVARRCHGVWAADAPEWLARLAEPGQDDPADLVRFGVERVEALLYWRLLVGRSVFGCVPGLAAERALSARARGRLADAHGLRMVREVARGADWAGSSLGCAVFAQAVPPALGWDPHLGPIETRFRFHGAARLRASELAQAEFFGAFGEDGLPEPKALAVLGTFDAERLFWIEWVAEQEVFHDFARVFGGECSTGTRERLKEILRLAPVSDVEEIFSTGWRTRWHEAERR